MPPLASSFECILLDEVLQVPGRGRARGAGDLEVIFGAEPAFEPGRTFPKHPRDSFVLALVQLTAVAVVKVRLADEEPDTFERDLLGREDDLGEPGEPLRHVQRLLVELELVVIGFPFFFDGKGERYEARLANVLRQRLFSQGAAQPAIAILERMDALKI